jgi:hypothetical protein
MVKAPVPVTVYLIPEPRKAKQCLRRRDSGCPEPPPQTRTCSIPASGSLVVLAFARAQGKGGLRRGIRGQCGSAMPRNLAGEMPAWVIVAASPVSSLAARTATDASMRRLMRRRGVKVTGGADLEGVEPRKFRLESAEGFGPLAGNNPYCATASDTGTPRGPRPCRA